MDILLLPLQVLGIAFITVPPLALVPAIGFAVLFATGRRVSSLLAAVAWFVYAGYEGLMVLRILCSGDCNIRIDLLLIYPLLLVLSGVALVTFWIGRRARRHAA